MGEPVSSSVLGAFYEALASRDPIRLSKHLADDVEWFMAGPVHLFSFCGYRAAKRLWSTISDAQCRRF